MIVLCLCIFILLQLVGCQDIITTIAGTGSGSYSGDSSQATSAALKFPMGLALDSSGNVYIADENNHRIRKVTVATGIITTIAGTGSSSYSGDNGQASSAAVRTPTTVAVDSSGNVYIADYGNHRIRKVTASTGIITLIAGTGTSSYSGDNGAATSAALYYPVGVALDTSGNVYIADTSNQRIRKVTISTGIIATIAGSGGTGSFSGDNGSATSAFLNNPYGIALDSSGNVYITDGNRIRKVTISTGIITTFAGTGSSSYSGDNGPATSAAFGPQGVTLDSTGNVYIADSGNNRIRKVTISTGIITTIAGTGATTYAGDNGQATSATLSHPRGVAVDSSGNIYIVDSGNNRVRKVTVPTATPSVSPTPVPSTATPSTATPSSSYPSLSPSAVFIISTIAGNGTASYSGDSSQATSAALYFPMGVALDSSGNVYIADEYNHRIRKVTVATGIVKTIAGTGTASYSGDNGQASSAKLNTPTTVAVDSSGNVYIADYGNHRIRKVTVSTGIITLLAGTGTGSYSGDNGQATSATFNGPGGVVLDSSGNVFIADTNNQRIRKVTVSTGIVSLVAGSGGTGSFSGDNGQATAASLNYPYGIVLDSLGNVYIADYNNNRIRKVTVSTGIITTFAGTGTGSYSGDNGPVTSATLNYPAGVTLDSSGNVYIADAFNNRIRKVTVSTGIITTLAGTGATTYAGDNGPASSAALSHPRGVAVDSSGNVYIVDSSNNRVRKVTVTTNSPSMSPTSVPSTANPSSSYPSMSPSTTFIISTIAGTGTGTYSGDNGAATSAALKFPAGVALDSSGNMYIGDQSNHRIRKLTVSTGIITTFAGTGTNSYSGDNSQATSATLNSPHGVVLDSSGNVYIGDRNNNRVRKVTVSTGIITTVAGSSTSGSYSGDGGQATSANLYYAVEVALDSAGNVYITDNFNHRIRKVTITTGVISTIAGTGSTGYSGDNGQATSATLYYPRGVGLDSSGNVYIGDQSNNRIRKVTVSTGIITTFAGSSTSTGYSGDNGPATSAVLNNPWGITLDSAGNVYFSDDDNNRVRKVSVSTGVITTIAGSSTSDTYSGDSGPATSAKLYSPGGLTVDATGNVYVADCGNHRIRKVTVTTLTPSMSPTLVPTTATPSTATPSSNYPSMSPSTTFIISTVAGTGTGSFSGDAGAATSATLTNPTDVAVDSSGNLYIADFNNNRIRMVTVSTGIISTFAGSTSTGYSGDNGLASSAGLYGPEGVEVDALGNVYIADRYNHRIRKVTISSSIIITIAGTGANTYSGDNGQASSAALNHPTAVVVDSEGNVYIADHFNHRIRKLTVSTGIITTVAGTGSSSYSGDNGPATSAALYYPGGVALDAAGNVYISDCSNHRVRKVSVSTGIITTIAGNGITTYSGDGIAATSTGLSYPCLIASDSLGNVYIPVLGNYRVFKVSASTGIITTVAGTGVASYSGDNGQATSATLSYPFGVAVDASGNVYIADQTDQRIRKVTITTKAPSMSPTSVPSTASPSNYPSLSPSTVFIISTIAGTGASSYSGDGGAATAAALNDPQGVVLDSSGNVYIADTGNNRIRKLTVSTGIITTIAGTGTAGYSGDNSQATSAEFNYPVAVTLDASGNFFIADTYNYRVRKVTASTGIITTVAGTGTSSYSGDNGQATSAALYNPAAVAVDASGNVYIGDVGNNRVRKVTIATSIITTFAGTGVAGYSGDNGQATSATLNGPRGIAVDAAGSVYIGDCYNNRIRKVTVSTGIITSVAGSSTSTGYSGDNGPGTSATLYYPWGVALDSAGNVYFSDDDNHRIRKVAVSTGIITTIAGTGTQSYSGDNGPATSATFKDPAGVAVDASGNVYIADCFNQRVRKVTVTTYSPSMTPTMTPSTATPSTAAPSSNYPSLSPSTAFIISTIAGTGSSSYSGDDGAATSAALYNLHGLRLDAAGNVYIADTYNHRIRKVTVSTGIITTFAGTGSNSYSGDNGQASSAAINYPSDVDFDAAGNVYIADTINNRVRKVTVSTGIITTVAGNGGTNYSGDNVQATNTALNTPYGIALDSAGNMYIADTYNSRIRKITVSTGIITTIAGTGTSSYSGDNGQATAATLHKPFGVALDSSGNVYFTDTYNHCVRKVTVSTGIITTIAGTGSATYSGDNGPATSASLHYPWGIAVDSAGNIYIGDWVNNRIRKVTIPTGIITTIAGTGTASYSGDNGQAVSATLSSPLGVALDSAGNVYVADYGNQRVRKVTVTTNFPSMNPTLVPSTATPSTASPSNYPSMSPSTTFIISTVAGTGFGSYSGDAGAATSAGLNFPQLLALDSSGNMYIADSNNNRIRKVTISTGIITTIAGSSTSNSYSGDNGQATAATMFTPDGVTVDASGNVYITDSFNNRVRKVTVSTGIIATIAGTGTASYSGDNGQATSAAVNFPASAAVDSTGNVFIADHNNHRIRKVTISTGVITTYAGNGGTGSFSGDGGQATAAFFDHPAGLCLDASGNMYITDQHNHRIRKVTVSTGIITTIAGIGSTTFTGDNGPATSASLYYPYGITLDSAGNVYIADGWNHRIRKVTMSTGILSTFSGTGSTTYNGDAMPATSANLYYAVGVAVDATGNVYIADYGNHRVRKVTVTTYSPSTTPTMTPSTATPSTATPSSNYPSLSPSTVFIISTVAGTGTQSYSGDNVQATSATLNNLVGVRVDTTGNIYIADTYNHRIRKVTVSTGIITTFAGTGSTSYSGDNGQATSAAINYPSDVDFDSTGNVYIADSINNRVRKVTVSTGIITTYAGNGGTNYSGDNVQATSTALNNLYGIAMDLAGNMYIADSFNHRVRKVTVATGIITTIAGTGTSSYSGDGGAATNAALYKPHFVAVDSLGNVYIADTYNHRVRKVTVSTGIITTLAGTGSTTYSGDNGPATSGSFYFPWGIAVDSTGNVYIGDSGNNRVRKVTVSTGIITTFAGTGVGTYNGDNGQATSATLSNPYGVALDLAGNVYIADYGNQRVRKVTVTTNAPSMSPTSSPSTATPSTASPSNYPSLSPSTVFIISTIAGSSTSAGYSGDNGLATSAGLNYPTGVAVDTSGNVYFTDNSNHRVRKVTLSTGIITTVAGTGTNSYSGDNGPATSAALFYPEGIAVDVTGNVYISDTNNCRIRKVTVSTGIISTVAGNGGTGSYSGDNVQATSAALFYPRGVSVDSSGNVYIADKYNHRIRKVTISTGIITTLAGTGSSGYNGDTGQATSAALNQPSGVTTDSSGNVYISDANNSRIRKVTVSTGIITTVAGTGTSSYSGDNGPATSAALSLPALIVLDSVGNIYFPDQMNNRIRKVTVSTGIMTTFAGTGTSSYSGDGGAATAAALYQPFGVALDTAGNMYIADCFNQRVRKVTTSSPSMSPTSSPSTATPTTSTPSNYPSLSPSTVFIISTLAGTGASSYSGDGGAATAAAMNVPVGLTFNAAGDLYIADYYNSRIRKVTVSTGIITTFAGSSTSTGYSGDNGQASSAALYYPVGVALDSSGNVYIGDQFNNRIRKVTVSTGIITTFAGTGTGAYSGDNGPATSAALCNPSIVTLDSSGNVYIADQCNHRIRKVTVSTGIITTVAGTGSASYSGDNGPSTSAALSYPSGVEVDSTGNVYIADKDNHRIRKITISTGIITTIAGNGGTGSYSGDGGAGTSAALYLPYDIVLDATGNVFIADVFNNRVRKVTISTGIINTIAGTGSTAYNGENIEATSANLYYPHGVALDASGNLYYSDSWNNRVRKVTMTTAATSTPSLTPSLSPTSMPTKLPTTSPSTASTTFVPSQPPTVAPSLVPSRTPTAAPSILPSIVPSNVPSVIPSTMQPSYTPTLSPSAYPTYSSSVRVYFMVTHGLTGISASTYSNSKASNDALLKQTVASMLGYDSRKEDVTIQLVTDAVQKRALSASAATAIQECVVMYSITTPTFIFNDTNHATAKFIQALNESIATGTFDLVLLTNAGSTSSWQSVSTVYTIFSTASPTSSPTSTPTLAPTKRDNVVANLLTVPLDASVAKAKVKYYLGTFMGYFLAIYICLYLYSFLRYGKLTATRLYDSSYQSELHDRNSAVTSGGVEILSDLLVKNRLVQSNMKLQDELMVVKQSSTRKFVDTTNEESKYSKGYREYVQQQRTLLGCSPFLYPEGCVVKVPCMSRQIVFPPGRMEDIMLYICHNHPLFSCFYFMDGSKLGAHGTRILYIGKDVAVFVLYQFSNMLLQYFMLDGHGLGTFINLFIITPSAVSVGLLLKYLYTCPFTETVEFQRKYAKYQSVVLFLGRLAILPIMVIMFGSLLIACLFSSNRDVPVILVNYFMFVQFFGVVLAIVKALLLFIDGYYYKLSLFGVLDILCVGQLYKERILAEQLVVDVDYAYRIHTYLFGLVKVQKVLNRDDAIKAKWITIERKGGGGGDSMYDIEMKGSDTNINDETVISVQMNPLTNHTVPRNSVAFSMDGIYSASNNSDNVGGYNLHSNSSSDNTVIATENPIHSLASMLNTVSLRPTNTRQEEPRQQSVTLANESVNNAVAAEDDAALYLEYQALHESQDEALYAIDGDNEVTVSFEEWKSRRKQFKQGTRGSFVKAFQVFEEREQLALEQLEQAAPSESVKNTLKLHSTKVKNLLAATRAFSAAGKRVGE